MHILFIDPQSVDGSYRLIKRRWADCRLSRDSNAGGHRYRYIVLGDTTSCGGRVLSGRVSMTINGREIACVGDVVSCGKSAGLYHIINGAADVGNENQQAVAVEWLSHTTCPCNAFLIGGGAGESWWYSD